jgi:DNA-binding NtrC family response regulator
MKSKHPGSFYPPPSSISPTKRYDTQSQVLVVSKNDDILKFMKVHLNRYFSHVEVHKSYTEGFEALGAKVFDLAIIQANPQYNPTMLFLKRMGTQHRSVPVIVVDPHAESTPESYPGPVVMDVITPPFNLDQMHIAIRKALNIRASLRSLDETLPPRSNIDAIVRGANDAALSESSAPLVEDVRQKLGENIED